MNERIRELAEQCGFRSNPDIYDRNQSFDIGKFTELIVRECAGLFPAEYDTVEGKITIGKIIKEHFGVE